jgi:hypothetical protein
MEEAVEKLINDIMSIQEEGRNRGARGEGQSFYGIVWKSRNFLLFYKCMHNSIRPGVKQVA